MSPQSPAESTPRLKMGSKRKEKREKVEDVEEQEGGGDKTGYLERDSNVEVEDTGKGDGELATDAQHEKGESDIENKEIRNLDCMDADGDIEREAKVLEMECTAVPKKLDLEDAKNGKEECDVDTRVKRKGMGNAERSAVSAKRKKGGTGVVYVSRIPPGMDVGALRSLLGRVGKLGRVWLRPESAEKVAERRMLGSRRRREEFKDGWVEFERRKDGKKAVSLLNGREMVGGKRRGRWGDDLWVLKFLEGYTWKDLVEESCGGSRERVLRVKAEIMAARRERGFVEERVALKRSIDKRGDGDGMREVRRFKQKMVIEEREWEEDLDERRAREAMKRVDKELESGSASGKTIDKELVGLLFKKRKVE